MSVDDRTEQFPCASTTVHAHHAENLEEAEAAESRRGEDLAAASERNHDDAGHDSHDI